jgi:TetR/AcrR family transcriptional regulator, transcriptional repressor for nem operon
MPTDTRTQLLTTAEAVVRRHGYAGFSYADLTTRVGIRKASVHHHFPAKEDLGVALVDTYAERFTRALADILLATDTATGRLDAYAGLYRSGLRAGQGCLCGVLTSELQELPERIQGGVHRFFQLNADWLAAVIAAGQGDGCLRADLEPRPQAFAVLASLQGAILVGLALGSMAAFDDAATTSLTALRRL